MIYHTAAEINYYNTFFKRWHRSITNIHPGAKFSLKFVGDTANTDVVEFSKEHNINLILDPTTPDDLIKKYGSMEIGCGYYPMARWNSLPVDDDVCVTDIDVVMMKDHYDEVAELLKIHDVVSISRLKQGEKINLMMVNYIKKDICPKVKDIAISLMDHKEFRWDIDLDVMSKIKNNFNITWIHKLKKFDRAARLIPDPRHEAYFGYYSAMPVTLDKVFYEGGLDAKRAKYEWADKHDVFNFSNNQ